MHATRTDTLFHPELLHARGRTQEAVLEHAGRVRHEVFGNKVFVRGVLEISNYCRQNCNYCGMRRDNKNIDRFRLPLDVAREIIFEHLPPAITDINIQAGEDVVAVRDVVPLLQEIRERTNLGISVCLGTLSPREYAMLKEAGASFYIIKMETGNPQHYKEVQAPGTFDKRVAAIRHLAETGWSVSSGFIAGLPGQTTEHMLETLRLLSDLPLAGNSVSPFIPGDSTPFGVYPASSAELSLNALALMRLANPQRIIPAVSAMNLVGKDAYSGALRAGANLTTINLTPPDARKNYLLYQRDRYIMDQERVLTAIRNADCELSTRSMANWLAENRKQQAGAVA
jgi:biotin synthase